ncbi:MAG: cysteine hydrolase [Lachnospiraceae bacterium]|nr:cysteine hydrolase [Lachnospiraceae bacterium]
MKEVLIVVDMQNDFIDGSLGSKEAALIVDNVKDKIQSYLDAGKKVIFTKDTHPENYLETYEGKHLPVVHCVKDTQGWQISSSLPWDDTLCSAVEKGTFGFLAWKDLLSDVTDIEICGLCTDICVISNALILRAIYPEKDIYVDAKCCAGVTPELHEAALKVMASNQIEVG